MISIDLSQFSAAIKDKQDKIQAATRPAAQAAIQVIYEQAKINVPVSSKGHWFHGKMFKVNGTKYWFNSGALKAAIYQAYSKRNSSPNKATYHVSWNAAKAPYGWMVELGTSKAPAHPFLGTAINAKADEAGQVMRRVFIEGVNK